MLSSPFLETIVSLTLIILIFSILVTCVQEGYVSIVKSRGKLLEKAIGEVLNDSFNKNFGYLLYQHPQIDLLKRKQGELPSYIDGETFARSLIDLIAQESTEIIYSKSKDGKTIIKSERFIQPILNKEGVFANNDLTELITPESFPDSVSLAKKFILGTETLQYSDLKKLLLSFHANTTRKEGVEDLDALKTQIQTWYNNYMDRVTGWYKRKVRINLFFAAAVVTMIFNLNFITLTKTIYADTKLRKTLTTMADSLTRQENPISSLQNQLLKDSLALGDIDVNAIVGTELPVGWKDISKVAAKEKKTTIGYFFSHELNWQNMLGWLIFILALSLGAPFWFDVLKKLVNIRSTGISPQEKNRK